MITSGRIVISFFPGVEGDVVYATLEMPDGTAVQETIEAVKIIERAADQIRTELDADLPNEADEALARRSASSPEGI